MSAVLEVDDVVDVLVEQLLDWGRARVNAADIDNNGRIPEALLKELADMGVFGASLPVAFGGSELGLWEVCRLADALARVDRSVATTVGLHLGLGTRGLVRYGTPEQQEHYLPQLASGEVIAAFAATEAEAGSHLAAIRTTAVQVRTGLQVDGAKVFVTNGGLAGLFTVYASTPGRGGRFARSLVLIEAGDRGVSLGAEEHKLGLRGSSTRSVYLDGVVVPEDRIIGVPGQGTAQIEHVLAWGRTVMAAGCVGTARKALALTLPHLRGRQQFNRPLAALDVVRDQVAYMAARIEAGEALVQHAATSDDEALLPRSMVAKVFCSQTSGIVCDLAVQLHGGSGFIEETGVALLARDTRVTRIFEGANDVLLTRIGAATLMAPAESVSKVHPSLAEPHRIVTEVVDQAREYLVQTFGARVGRHPRELHRLGRMVVCRDSVIALTRRAPNEAAVHWAWLAAQQIRAMAPVPASADALAEVVL